MNRKQKKAEPENVNWEHRIDFIETDGGFTAHQDSLFETTAKTLRPFMKTFSVSSGGLIKFWIKDDANDAELEAIVASSNGQIERGNNGLTFFVRFDINNEDAYKIVSRVFAD